MSKGFGKPIGLSKARTRGKDCSKRVFSNIFRIFKIPEWVAVKIILGVSIITIAILAVLSGADRFVGIGFAAPKAMGVSAKPTLREREAWPKASAPLSAIETYGKAKQEGLRRF